MTDDTCTKQMPSLIDDVGAFHADPMGCDESVVVRIKDAVKASWNDWIGSMRIGPVDSTTVRVYNDLGDWELAIVENDEVAPRITTTVQQVPFMSSDPEFIAPRLVCDGGCGKSFALDDLVYTDHDDVDYCQTCGPRDDRLTLTTVRDRATRIGRNMLTAIVGSEWVADEDDSAVGE